MADVVEDVERRPALVEGDARIEVADRKSQVVQGIALVRPTPLKCLWEPLSNSR